MSWFDSQDDLVTRASQEMRIHSTLTSSLAFLIHTTRDYTRCSRLSTEYKARCIHLPEHGGQCKIITDNGAIIEIIGRTPSPALWQLVEVMYGLSVSTDGA